MRYRAEVVTKWVETVDAEGMPTRFFELAGAFPEHPMSLTDLTHQSAVQIIPGPNSVTVEVICDGEALGLIEADDRFTVLPVTTEYRDHAEGA